MLSDTMQVDNVSCECLLSPTPKSRIHAKKKKKNNIPGSFCVVTETFCSKLHLTDVLSSEPCSFPCAAGPTLPPLDADRAQKHGMDEFISANPCSFDHASLFEMVQRLTLDHRLNDTFCCLVSGVRGGCMWREARLTGGGGGGDTFPPLCFVFVCRDGSARARCLSWMSTAPGMASGVVTDTCVTCVTSWRGRRAGRSSTPPSFTTALLSAPPTCMGTGVAKPPLFFHTSSTWM